MVRFIREKHKPSYLRLVHGTRAKGQERSAAQHFPVTTCMEICMSLHMRAHMHTSEPLPQHKDLIKHRQSEGNFVSGVY